jgi:serine/threonine-protein kinase PknG
MLDTEDAPDAERLRQSAERHYRTLWRTDHSIVSAAFGLARGLAARDDRAGAIAVLDQVPLTSRHYAHAQLTSVLMLLDGRPIATPAATDPILGHAFDQQGLCTGIEEALRELARHSPRRRHRYTLVDLANSIRPPSWM